MSKIDHRAAITNVRYDKTRTKKGNVSRAAVKKAVYGLGHMKGSYVGRCILGIQLCKKTKI